MCPGRADADVGKEAFLNRGCFSLTASSNVGAEVCPSRGPTLEYKRALVVGCFLPFEIEACPSRGLLPPTLE